MARQATGVAHPRPAHSCVGPARWVIAVFRHDGAEGAPRQWALLTRPDHARLLPGQGQGQGHGRGRLEATTGPHQEHRSLVRADLALTTLHRTMFWYAFQGEYVCMIMYVV